jgi:ABC-2 type transport system ATP-binding protein
MIAEPLITVAAARRRFRQTVAIADISLAIQPGELFGIVGPDGAGKSTLLRLMAAVLDPTGGRITIAGYDSVADAEAIKALMGYMPQRFGLYDDLTVQENLDFTAAIYDVKGAQLAARLTQLYQFTNLASFRDFPAGKLSGGMQKKLALACALIHEPALLLLDEPTTGVDPVARRDFWDLLSGLHAEGTTTVVSTPYMDEAERCNRVALLYQGAVLACDTPAAIKAQVPGAVLALTSSDNVQAEQLLQGLAGLIDIQTYGNLLNLIVADPEAAYGAIAGRLANAGVTIHSLQEAPLRMEEAFIYLVNHVAAGEAVGEEQL